MMSIGETHATIHTLIVRTLGQTRKRIPFLLRLVFFYHCERFQIFIRLCGGTRGAWPYLFTTRSRNLDFCLEDEGAP